jgi:hypothetical protein
MWIRLSELISPQFFDAENQFNRNKCFGKSLCWIDLIYHVLLWVAVLITQILSFAKKTHGHDSDADDCKDYHVKCEDTRYLMSELQVAAFVSAVFAVGGLVLVFVLGFWSGKTPSTILPIGKTLLMGSLFVSLVFSAMYLFYIPTASHDVARMANKDDDDGDDDEIGHRHVTFWLVALKIFLLEQLNANANFFGPRGQLDAENSAKIAAAAKKEKTAAPSNP